MTEPRCAIQSLAVDEPLFGTAPHEQGWLFLEYTGPWGAKIVAESDLPSEVKAWLEELRQKHHIRISFLRRTAETPPPWRVFLWLPDPQGGICARWEVPTLDELRALPWASWLTREQPLPPEAQCRHPLYLVCVNGRRDACCGRFGPILYRALQRLRPAHSWMTTHVGGHRFAPNVLVLPQGLAYGRIHSYEDAAAVVQATERGEVHLGFLRGRMALPQPAQAAEHFLRRKTGLLGVSAFTFIRLHEVGDQAWQAAFLGPNERAYLVSVRRETLPFQRLTSCQASEAKPVRTFALQDLQTYPVRRYASAGGVVVNQQGQVLVLLRPSRREIRLPKGHIEPGEEAWHTAQREISEEAGLPPETLHLLADLGERPVGFLHEAAWVWRHERYFLVRWSGGATRPAEDQFIPLWLTWDQAQQALTFEAERAWLRQAREAWARLAPAR